MVTGENSSREISQRIQEIKDPDQQAINLLYKKPGMPELENRYAVELANRPTRIEQAMLYADRDQLAQALSWLRFPEEPVRDLLENTLAIFINLQPRSGVAAVDIRLSAFNDGGYSKGADNRVIIQRAGNTQLPAQSTGLWNDATRWETSLVAIHNDETVAPVLTHFRTPNKDVVPGKVFTFEYHEKPVQSPLIVAIPHHEKFAQHSANSTHDGASMYCARAILLARHNQKNSVTVEPSQWLLAKLKASNSVRKILPSK